MGTNRRATRHCLNRLLRARGTGLARAASGRLKIAQSSTPNVPLTSRSRRNPRVSRHVASPPNAGLCALAVAEHPPRHRVTGPHCCHTSVASPTRVQPPKHKIEYCTPNPNRHLVRGTEWGENDKISGYRQRGEPQSPAAPVADVARVRGAGPGQRARADSGHTLLSYSPSESMKHGRKRPDGRQARRSRLCASSERHRASRCSVRRAAADGCRTCPGGTRPRAQLRCAETGRPAHDDAARPVSA